jgi:nucleotide-binding universal stress UspA family protein
MVHLLHVVEFPFYLYGEIPPEAAVVQDAMEDTYRAGQEMLAKFRCEHFCEDGIAEVDAVCDRGDPGYAILAEAERWGADLIMMPTHGNGPFRSFLVGSATVRVLHQAKCAVWTGTHLETESAMAHVRVGRILCALDLERESIEVIEAASALARTYSAEVRLVHCVPVPEAGPTTDFLSQFDRYLAEAACEKLRDLQVAAGTDFEVSMEGGRISRVVRESALRHGSDLIVIGRGHTHSRLSRLRSNAYAIIRDAPCPVLSL